MSSLIKQLSKLLTTRCVINNTRQILAAQAFHTSNVLEKKWNRANTGPMKWLQYNKVLYPPQEPHAEPRNAFVCHMKTNIKYSPDKMWYIASFVRGMTVDEAVKQLNFVFKKGAQYVKETILEAQDMAVRNHNVEFKSNLWVAESFVGKGRYFRGVRRHARGRQGKVEYKHCHYFVRLEEGKPPKDYYLPAIKTPQEQFDQWMTAMRSRKITHTL